MNAAAPDLPMYKATFDRNLEMQREGIVSRQALDDTNSDYLSALTKRDKSKAQIGVDTAHLKQARAQVAQNQAGLKQLEEQLGYTTILAPMDGVILSRDVEIGDAVSSILVLGSTATLVMTEGDTTRSTCRARWTRRTLPTSTWGSPRASRWRAFATDLFYGKVTKIAPMGVEKDNVTTFEVRVSINNPGGELKAQDDRQRGNSVGRAQGRVDSAGECGELRRPEECDRRDSGQEAERRHSQDSGEGWAFKRLGD